MNHFYHFIKRLAYWKMPQFFLFVGSLAQDLGENYHGLMAALSAFAAIAHISETMYAFYVAGKVHKLRPIYVLLWSLNTFFFGIFGLWPLAFPEFYFSIEDDYCRNFPC